MSRLTKHIAILFILAFLNLPLQAQFTNVSAVATYGTLHVFFTSGSSGNVTLKYGTSCSSLPTGNTTGVGANVPSRAWPLSGLTANTSYCFSLSNGANTWDCRVTPALSGAGCDATTGYGLITTAALPTNFGSINEIKKPNLSGVLTAPPTPTLTALNVAANNVSDLYAKLDQCATTTPAGQAREVLLPAGSVYVVNKQVMSLPTGAFCIVRTADATTYPPDGVRITPKWTNQATLISSVTQSGTCCDFSNSLVYGIGARGWYFLGLRFEFMPSENFIPTEYPITDVSSDGRTLTVPTLGTDLRTYKIAQVWGINGTWLDAPNGPAYIAGTPVYPPGSEVPPTTVVLNISAKQTGTYTGGGKIRLSVATNISGISNTTPPVVTTSRNHGFADKSAVPITSIATDGTITVPSGHGIGGDLHVYIEGSSVAAWNGIRHAASVTSTTVVVDGTLPTTACSSNCGTVRQLDPIGLKFVGGMTSANGTHYYRVIDETHLALIDVVPNAAYTSGGVVAQEPSFQQILVVFDQNSRDIYFDRCYFPSSWPRRVATTLSLQSSYSAVINSYFEDNQFFMLPRPGLGVRATTVFPLNGELRYQATVEAIDLTSGVKKIIQNNFLQAHGTTLFMQDACPYTTGCGDYPAPIVPNDILVRRNYFLVKFDKLVTDPSSDGFWYPHRHHTEWKRGSTAWLDGNIYDGGWADFNNCGPVMMITPRTHAANVTTDILATNNSVQNITEGFYMISTDDNPASRTATATTRVGFYNNLFTNMYGDRHVPQGFGSVYGLYQACGRPFRFEIGGESVYIDHNTIEMSKGGSLVKWLSVQNIALSGLFVRNNITYMRGLGGGGGPLLDFFWDGGVMANLTPNPSIGATNNLNMLTRVFGPHSVFSHNYFVPGPNYGDDNSVGSWYPGGNTHDYNDCAVATTQHPDDPIKEIFYGMKGINCVGSPAGGDTANQRIAAVKWIKPIVGGDYRLRHDSPLLASKDRSVPIVKVLSNVVQFSTGPSVPVAHQVHTGYTVKVQGATYTVTAVTNWSATLSGSAPDCLSSCGSLTSPDFGPTTDGRDPGADMDALENAQGKVGKADSRATGTTTAQVWYTAPDADACTVEYSLVNAPGSYATNGGARVSDGGGVVYRTVNLTGLAPATKYYWWVLCAVEQPTGSFTTK